MGDVDALCKRIVIIDKGKMLFDNDIEHLSELFGAYRTLILSLNKKGTKCDEEHMQKLSDDVLSLLSEEFSDTSAFSLSFADDKTEILIDESKTSVVKVLNAVQKKYKIYDMHLQDISTESVIRKIYEGGI
jgi:ABC-2 type transport system ATP-binding protein